MYCLLLHHRTYCFFFFFFYVFFFYFQMCKYTISQVLCILFQQRLKYLGRASNSPRTCHGVHRWASWLASRKPTGPLPSPPRGHSLTSLLSGHQHQQHQHVLQQRPFGWSFGFGWLTTSWMKLEKNERMKSYQMKKVGHVTHVHSSFLAKKTSLDKTKN